MKSALLPTFVFALTLVGCGGSPTGSGGGGGGGGGGSPDGSTDSDAGQIATPAHEWSFVPVDGSMCASGARAGFGLNLNEAREDLLIFVQGGGACWNQGTCRPSWLQFGPICEYGTWCLYDGAGGTKPTAVYVADADPFPADGGGAFPTEINTIKSSRALDRSDPTNPFRNASFVFVPYCTGDLHAGNGEQVYPYKTDAAGPIAYVTIHFAGATNMDAYLAKLKGSFPNLKRIWLMGVSGGAYGATFNFDRVQAAFPNAEVHLLADSGPFVPTVHWEEMKAAWNPQFPSSCTGGDCDAGMPQIIDRVISQNPTRRIGLLSYDQDAVIAWFFYAPPGANNALNPPTGVFANNLVALESTYDAYANSKYFVLGGTQHVLFGGYGAVQADGGYTQPYKSHDGGTDLKAFVDGWATGGAGWESSK